jgi:demethylmenaquinone methyltransferase/2-methoxy-6-polyprenyl-1,4-benzoquinol methylase
MNDLMSMGLHRYWKRFAIELSGVRAGQSVLDVASGSGDLAAAFARRVGAAGRVVMTDINEAMLQVGRDKLMDRGLFPPLALCDAEKLPFPSESFDLVSVAFGLRNMTHKDRALAEMARVTRPGGRVIVLEFSKPWKPLERAYDAYSFSVLPALGKFVAQDEAAYRYLAESIRMHPDQETLKAMMAEAGLGRVEYFNLTAGVVALHRGFKL